ncbi:MAG: hypothetical protein LBH59_04940 [Planctomycetaceae bacterium]|nr:hypothetical protein [Planctomycetaceae bacterium]
MHHIVLDWANRGRLKHGRLTTQNNTQLIQPIFNQQMSSRQKVAQHFKHTPKTNRQS